MCIRSSKPPPKTLPASRTSSSGVTRPAPRRGGTRPRRRAGRLETRASPPAPIHGGRATRVKRTARGGSAAGVASPESLKDALPLQQQEPPDEQACVGMERSREDFADRRELHEPASVHDAEPVDELRHQANVVADEDDRCPEVGLRPRQRIHDLPLHDDVEGARGLIGHDHPRRETHGDGDADALLHPAGQLMRKQACDLGAEAHPGKELAQPRVELVPRGRDAMVPEGVGDLVLDSQHGIRASSSIPAGPGRSAPAGDAASRPRKGSGDPRRRARSLRPRCGRAA